MTARKAANTAAIDPEVAPRLRAMFVGDSEWEEFQQVLESLRSGTHLSCAASIDAAAALLAELRSPPELVVIAQTRPGQFNEQQVHLLRRSVPLTRFVCVLGSWCEGEARTGRPWPAMPRLYWHQWPVAGPREMRRLVEAADSWWQLPPTAAADERFMVTHRDEVAPQSGLVLICANDWESSEALADACSAAGYHSVWYRRDRPPRTHGARAIVWNGSGLDAASERDLRRLSQDFRGIPLIALVNYPRLEDMQLALCCGATSVLSKPFLIDDLLAKIAGDRVHQPTAEHVPCSVASGP